MTVLAHPSCREVESRPGLRRQPAKLFVETTSRCNLNCVMCMKQTSGQTGDGDLQPGTFAALEPAFPDLEALVLNGIGEPLLHPHLERFIGRAKKLMPARSWVGFQSNGLLLTKLRAVTLAKAGVDRICLSMDGASAETFRSIREGGQLRDLECALAALTTAKAACGRPDLQVGVEFVVMRDNLRELPSALRWAAARGATFAIASHVLPYDEAHTTQAAYDLCTIEAISLFHAWEVKAELAGVDLRRYFDILWKYQKTAEEQRIANFVETMKADAQNCGITLDLRRLLAAGSSGLDEVVEVFEEAREVARETGLDLRLPEAAPRERRRCDFVEQGERSSPGTARCTPVTISGTPAVPLPAAGCIRCSRKFSAAWPRKVCWTSGTAGSFVPTGRTCCATIIPSAPGVTSPPATMCRRRVSNRTATSTPSRAAAACGVPDCFSAWRKTKVGSEVKERGLQADRLASPFLLRARAKAER